ncbi:hypothetical protein H4R34_001940 [Dimargaris verticillata]|uniref:Uncharacterized protein n=1 Tax=Dimargaris verticillata TaxID=2761393 RepID=A0A9W8B551_9FUNG|nr:hypothetical protein H4R34_001940 [Dimargaris verticillata]
MDINWCVVCDRHIDSVCTDSLALYCSEACRIADARSESLSSTAPTAQPVRTVSPTKSPLVAGTTPYAGMAYAAARPPAMATPRAATRPVSIQGARSPTPGTYYAYSPSPPSMAASSVNSAYSYRTTGYGASAGPYHQTSSLYRVSPPAFNLEQSGFARSSNNYCTGSGSMYLRTASS